MTTDVLTARDFFSKGDFYWGVCTTLPVFAPFLARIILFCIRVARDQCYKTLMAVIRINQLPIYAT